MHLKPKAKIKWKFDVTGAHEKTRKQIQSADDMIRALSKVLVALLLDGSPWTRFFSVRAHFPRPFLGYLACFHLYLSRNEGLSLGSMLPSEERAVRAEATRAPLVLAKRIFGGFQAPWFRSRKRSTVLAVSRVDAGLRSPLEPMRGVIIILDGM